MNGDKSLLLTTEGFEFNTLMQSRGCTL